MDEQHYSTGAGMHGVRARPSRCTVAYTEGKGCHKGALALLLYIGS